MFLPLLNLHSQPFGSKTILGFANIFKNVTSGQYSFFSDVKYCKIGSKKNLFCLAFELDSISSEVYRIIETKKTHINVKSVHSLYDQ